SRRTAAVRDPPRRGRTAFGGRCSQACHGRDHKSLTKSSYRLLSRPMKNETRQFPAGFRWGTATAAHQIEGANWNNDWWEWEHAPGTPCVEPSGDACDSWNRWRDDIRLCSEIGVDSYRFSLEWSR